jgi:hypothetical protein
MAVLLKQASDLLEPQSAYDRKLHMIWGNFEDFCKQHGVACRLATENTILAYLIWMDFNGSRPELVLTSIARHHESCGLRDPTREYNIRRIAKLLWKRAAADREAPWPRDPFPVKALKKYIDNPPEQASAFMRSTRSHRPKDNETGR